MNATHTFSPADHPQDRQSRSSNATGLPDQTISTVTMIRRLRAPRPFTPRYDAPAPAPVVLRAARSPLETALLRATAIAVAAVAATALFLAMGPPNAPPPEVDTAAVSADASMS